MKNNHASVLVVEDEREVLQVNERLLSRRGYKVFTAENCREAYRVLCDVTPDLLILDIMLPDGSGYDICEKFRARSDNAVIFLSGKSEVGDKIDGLGRGGDYYLTKPYNAHELLAVVDRLINRQQLANRKNEELSLIKKGSLIIDIARSAAFVNGVDAALTSKEFALLLFLVQNEDTPLSPGVLYERVWDAPAGKDTRTVRFHIKNLRRKLSADNADDFDIISVYSKGYMFTTVC